MVIGVTEDHQALAASLRDWAVGLGGPALARESESEPQPHFDGVWDEVIKQGVATIAVAESLGGGGGDVLDLAVALEACAREMVPGPLLGTAVVATLLASAGESVALEEIVGGTPAGFAVEPSLAIGARVSGEALVYDAPAAGWMLLGGVDDAGAEHWFAARSDQASMTTSVGVDLSRRAASVSVDLDPEALVSLDVTAEGVRRVAVTLAAAEASGLASWCLATAAEYAKVREQFGQPIGRFQAVKQLCAVMAETAEAASAVAWDAASAASGDDEQWAYAADVAGAVALDGAVKVAQDCIQVLGGIGFTYEHDAHFYLRRAVALRSLLGSGDEHAISLATRAVGGTRRRLRIDFDGADAEIRPGVRETVARIAALPEADRREALVESGYLMPHWPRPYGLAASPVEQLVIDEELAAAGVERPDISIAGWAVPTILAHGTDAQRERFVRPSLLGTLVWCQLFSEPGAGSDLASLTTRAQRVEGGWSITGQKVWTSVARTADWAICLARTNPDERKHQGISYFLVDMTTPGIDVRPLRELTGEALFNEVFLDGVFVPDEMVVGEIGDGWRLARTTLANERVAIASSRLGTSVERAVHLLATRHERRRLVTNDADSSRTTPTRHEANEAARVGHAVALATTVSLLGVRVALRSLAGQQPGAESSVAKLLGVRSRQDASELAVELHGARALLDTDDVRDDVHEMLMTRALSIAGGTTQILRNVVAERILGLPR